MKATDYIRSKARLDSAYKQAGDALIALEPLRIHIPERLTDRGLALIEDITTILGFMAIITEDNFYAASTITCMIRTEPDRIGKVVVDDIAYIELFYNKGSKIVANTNLVMNDNLVHAIETEFWGKANIPWYYEPEDLAEMFMETGKYNGVTLGADPCILEYAASWMCRDPDDPTKMYRERKNAKADMATIPPYVISMKNVSFGSNNLSTKLGGSYYDPGMTSVLANPAERNEKVEWFLRQ